MDIKGKLKRLFADAMSVWGESGGKRPFTRRGMDENALLKEYRRAQESGNDSPDAVDKPRR
jgi:hypothetical protein